MKNGWYVYKPDKKARETKYNSKYLRPLLGCGKQVVQVIENDVWVTAVTDTYTVEEAGRWGKFKKKVKM
jgi:predicted subunit of tRNA(5-methylaminomethyl-2-thiouridylate) methyltransferase